MRKEIVRGAKSAIVPIGLILFAALVLLAILEGSDGGTVLCVVVFVILVLLILRFTVVGYEYDVVATELVINTFIGTKRIQAVSIPLERIKGVGTGKKLRAAMGRGFISCRCASLRGALFTGLFLLYEDGKKLRRLRFEPTDTFTEYLKVKLSGRYFEH
ncbi:MAG: hypothetical protein GX633_05675 [Clostridiales bacterium]|jgi:hypothetical protein|nr:hypothetical protein [Clostridiales bacterium]